MDYVVIEPDHATFQRVAAAVSAEADGREWANDLARELHTILEPAVYEVRSALMGMSTSGLPHAGEPLRQAVAANVEALARFDGRRPGARIRAKETKTVRNFATAPRRLNSRRGWRHPVFGNDERWTNQIGAPGWFDDTLRRLRPRLRRAAEAALRDRARRIARNGG